VGGRGESQDIAAAGQESRAELLQGELERLRWVIVQAMDTLAEQVLGQIQTTRDVAEQTESLLRDVRSLAPEGEANHQSELHLRQIRDQIEEAFRNLPESTWDDFGETCAQLARTLRRAHESD
jgi:hypothetical protein